MAKKDSSLISYETRRPQKTGGSSYVITLPKDWLKSLIKERKDLDENDPKSFRELKLGLISQPDNTLLITPYPEGRKVTRSKQIDLEKIPDETFLFRYLISTYIAGFSEININSKKAISLSYKHTIRDFIRMVIAMVIIEETETYINIKDVLDPIEMPFYNILQRQVTTTKNMAKETIEALEGCPGDCREQIKRIAETDNQVDTLYWLSTRLTNMILRDMRMSDLTGISADLAANLFLVSRHIERIADHVVRISENVLKIHKQNIDKTLIKKIENAINLAFEVFEISMQALFESDLKKANDSIDSARNFENKINELFDYVTQSKESLLAIFLDNIVESIHRIGEYSRDISENVMNYLVWEE